MLKDKAFPEKDLCVRYVRRTRLLSEKVQKYKTLRSFGFL